MTRLTTKSLQPSKSSLVKAAPLHHTSVHLSRPVLQTTGRHWISNFSLFSQEVTRFCNFNLASGQFDRAEEIVKMPSVAITNMLIHQLVDIEKSPLNETDAGTSPDQSGLFYCAGSIYVLLQIEPQAHGKSQLKVSLINLNGFGQMGHRE